MCTLTYHPSGAGYTIWFNRDEQKTRPAAIAPKPITQDGLTAIYPCDPVAGGTWIATNQSGITVALLNDYQSPHRGRKSRGLLVKRLAHAATCDAVESALATDDLMSYAGFKLALFAPNESPKIGVFVDSVWTLAPITVWPVTSSSYSEDVIRQRHQIFAAKSWELEAFHRAHEPSGPGSICVHRDEVQTVSLTRITVDATMVSMNYAPGSPCQNAPWQMVTVPRQ